MKLLSFFFSFSVFALGLYHDGKKVCDFKESKALVENYDRWCRVFTSWDKKNALKNYLKNFSFIEERSGYRAYRPKAETSVIHEFLIKKSRGKMRTIEKRPSGTTRTSYFYSKGLRRLIMKAYEGNTIRRLEIKRLSKNKKSSKYLVKESLVAVGVPGEKKQHWVFVKR